MNKMRDGVLRWWRGEYDVIVERDFKLGVIIGGGGAIGALSYFAWKVIQLQAIISSMQP